MEYSCQVWDYCSKTDSDRLEKLQLEAGRIVPELTAYARHPSIYDETGWEKLSDRRELRKLCLFYKIVDGNIPNYLCDLLPRTVNRMREYNLRHSDNVTIPAARLTLLQNSFSPEYY